MKTQCKRYLKDGKDRCTNEATHNILLGKDCFDWGLYVCNDCVEAIKHIARIQQILVPYTIIKLV